MMIGGTSQAPFLSLIPKENHGLPPTPPCDGCLGIGNVPSAGVISKSAVPVTVTLWLPGPVVVLFSNTRVTPTPPTTRVPVKSIVEPWLSQLVAVRSASRWAGSAKFWLIVDPDVAARPGTGAAM